MGVPPPQALRHPELHQAFTEVYTRRSASSPLILCVSCQPRSWVSRQGGVACNLRTPDAGKLERVSMDRSR